MNIVTTKDLINNIRICKYCGMELSEGIPHGLRECHLRAVARIADLEARAEKAEAMVEKLNSWVEKLMDVGWGMWRDFNFGGEETLNEIRWEQLANIISKERER